MKNIEFYERELKSCTIEGQVVSFQIGRKTMSFSDISTFINWLKEEHQILDDVEKKYLRNILEPLKTENTFLKKEQDVNCCAEYIYVGNVKSYKKGKTDFIYLPFFKRGTMYKGMEQDRKYTLEELGL